MVKNLTSGKTLSEEAQIAVNFLDKAFGMLLKKNSAGIILKTRLGIHTLFMKTSIDVAILDKNKKIVKIRENFMPNNFMVWNPKFDTVLELKSGILAETNTKIGDRLDF